jgi:hypothetical protein
LADVAPAPRQSSGWLFEEMAVEDFGMNILMDLRPVVEMSSSELCAHIRTLGDRAEAINKALCAHGQFVASAQMDDAICGLHKTLSCWNHAISWQSNYVTTPTPASDGNKRPNPCAGSDASAVEHL